MLENLKGKIKIKNVVLTKEPLQLNRGLFIFYRLHSGLFAQSKVYIFPLTDYQGDISENKFIKAKNIIPECENRAYSLEFNPYTCQVRMEQTQYDTECIYNVIDLSKIAR